MKNYQIIYWLNKVKPNRLRKIALMFYQTVGLAANQQRLLERSVINNRKANIFTFIEIPGQQY